MGTRAVRFGVWVLGGTFATLLFAAQSCGSDDGGDSNANGPDASAGSGGSSGSTVTGGSGGAGGAGGSSGAGGGSGAPPVCDMEALGCMDFNLELMGMPLPLAACCVDANTCGNDVTLLESLAMQDIGAMCQDPEEALALQDRNTVDHGDIQIDTSCPDITIIDPPLIGTVTGDIPLPGCCKPDNTCGGSTTVLPVAVQNLVMPMCVNEAGINTFIGGLVMGYMIPVPDALTSCTYTGSDASVPAGDGG